MDKIILERAKRKESEANREMRLFLLLTRSGWVDSHQTGLRHQFHAWRKSRFVAERLAGLHSRHAGRSEKPGSRRQEVEVLFAK